MKESDDAHTPIHGFAEEKQKYQKGQKSDYNIQDESDERVFSPESQNGGALSNAAFEAQKRLNKKWAGR